MVNKSPAYNPLWKTDIWFRDHVARAGKVKNI
jgi:hypothetical protein